jgi:hypothetical protein
LIADSSLASCQAEPRRFWPHQPLPGHGRFFLKKLEKGRAYINTALRSSKKSIDVEAPHKRNRQYGSIAPGETNRIPGNKVSMPLSTLSDKIHTAGNSKIPCSTATRTRTTTKQENKQEQEQEQQQPQPQPQPTTTMLL